MTILTQKELDKYLCKSPSLVEKIIDRNQQIQPNGIDLTLMKIEKFKTAGLLGNKNENRKLSETEEIPFNRNDWAYLKKGCYKIIFNEIVHLPHDIFAIAQPRSSLLRMGVTVETALWDSGYYGRSESLLIVFNPYGLNLQKNARLIQLIFFKLKTKVAKGYNGIYSGENIKPMG